LRKEHGWRAHTKVDDVFAYPSGGKKCSNRDAGERIRILKPDKFYEKRNAQKNQSKEECENCGGANDLAKRLSGPFPEWSSLMGDGVDLLKQLAPERGLIAAELSKRIAKKSALQILLATKPPGVEGNGVNTVRPPVARTAGFVAFQTASIELLDGAFTSAPRTKKTDTKRRRILR